VQITRFGGPEVLEIVNVPDPVPAEGRQLYDVSTAGLNFADPHQVAVRKPTSTRRPRSGVMPCCERRRNPPT
jgi:NADPH:quinone reductase-like Zn-dependent oxidoreductase